MTPEEKGVALSYVGRGNFHAERVAKTSILVPVTNMRSGYPVGAFKAVEKARQPALRIGNGCAAACAFGQGDGARTGSRVKKARPVLSSVLRPLREISFAILIPPFGAALLGAARSNFQERCRVRHSTPK